MAQLRKIYKDICKDADRYQLEAPARIPIYLEGIVCLLGEIGAMLEEQKLSNEYRTDASDKQNS